MPLDAIFFWLFALITLGGAVMTVISRNAVHSAVWLISSLLGTAGLFLLQKAEFLFAVQIILYIGGIMLLFLFVIMLVNLNQQAKERQFSGQWWIAALVCVVVAIEFGFFVKRGIPDLPARAEEVTHAEGNIERLADVLFTQYLVPFEAVSLLLLAAIVGSVLMARVKRS